MPLRPRASREDMILFLQGNVVLSAVISQLRTDSMPSKLAMNRPRKDLRQDKKKPESIFSDNASKIVSRVVFAIGVLALFSYFFHIEYFPAFDLKSAASYVTSLAYVLTILVVSLSLAMLIPYVMAAVFIRAKPTKRGLQKLIAEIIEWMFFGMLSMAAISFCIFLSVYVGRTVENGAVIGLFALTLISSIRAYFIKSRRGKKGKVKNVEPSETKILSFSKSGDVVNLMWLAPLNSSTKISDSPLAIPLASKKWYFKRHIWRLWLIVERSSKPNRTQRLWERKSVRGIVWSQWWGTLITGILQFLPLGVLLLTLGSSSDIKEDDYSSFFMIAMQSALCVAMASGFLLYLALSAKYRQNWHWAVGLMLALPILLNLMSQATGMLPMAAMQITKNGNFRAEKMIISAKSCESIAPVLGIECNIKNQKPIALCNVHVMTRVGPEAYLRLPERKADREGKHRVQRVFVPTSDIQSIDANFSLKFLSLKRIDQDLAKLSPECPADLITLYSDSAFKFDDFTLTEIGKSQLIQLSQVVNASSKSIKELLITGYTDRIGSTTHNAWLSNRRAEEVRVFLERQLKNSESPISFVVSAKGSANPIIEDCEKAKDRVACEAPNRRVELQIIKKEDAGIRPPP